MKVSLGLLFLLSTAVTISGAPAKEFPGDKSNTFLAKMKGKPFKVPKTFVPILSKSFGKTRPSMVNNLKVTLVKPKKGDSPMYLITLPSTQMFYAPRMSYNHSMGEQVNINFTNNGKPEKVYHYNLPDQKLWSSRSFLPFNHHLKRNSFKAFITKEKQKKIDKLRSFSLPNLSAEKSSSIPKISAESASSVPNASSENSFSLPNVTAEDKTSESTQNLIDDKMSLRKSSKKISWAKLSKSKKYSFV